MSSFATAGGGALKEATSLLAQRQCYHPTNVIFAQDCTGTLPFAYTTAGLKTAVNITGVGIWEMGFLLTNNGATTGTVKVTLDGVVILNDTNSMSSTYGMAQLGSLAASFTYAGVSSGYVPFNKSLLIEVSCDVDAVYLYNYYLT